jgi:hypothetical protein
LLLLLGCLSLELLQLSLAVKSEVICLRSEFLENQSIRFHGVVQSVGGTDKTVSKLLILNLIQILAVLVSPQVQEIVSEKLKLAFQLLIVLLHGTDFLFQSFDISFLNFFQMEFENLNSQFHFSIVIELHTVVFVFVDPSLELVNVLVVEEGP